MPTITRKLYPPTIGNRIPAFQQDYDNNLFITVPFQNNRSVARADIITIALKLKTITNDFRTINGYAYVEEGQSLEDAITNAWNKGEVTFKLTPDQYQTEDGWFLNVGQFYKIQLAYIATFTPEEEEPTVDEYAQHVGYYSTVGISKFSWYPTVYIDGLDESSSNDHIQEYFGRYSQTYDDGESGDSNFKIADSTEKVYNYRFIITNTYNEETRVVKDSGWLLHDASTDESEYESYDRWEYFSELPNMGETKIQYQVKTTSGIEANSEEYSLSNTMYQGGGSDPERNYINYDFDNGYVEMGIGLMEGWPYEQVYILRTDLETKERVKIKQIKEYTQPTVIFRDFTVEQGKTYRYQMTYKVGGSPVLVDSYFDYEVKIDFEDIFLFDGERQLKVRFNPSMSGIHEVIMESNTNTIGGKYPFFFRNGDVRYRDFTLGGLVSFHMDEQRLFSIYGVEDQPTRGRTYTPMPDIEDFSLPTDLTGRNFTHERKFREEVLAWLNDGKIKLFRSPSEGIMMVRLSGCSMSPDQTTSRMIYSFSCQGVEAAGHEYEDLVKNNIYKLS